MNRFVQALAQIIQNETELHRQLLQAAEDKRVAIISGDIAAMENSLNREYDLVEKVEAQEQTRIALVEKMAEMLQIADRPVTMALLLEKLPANLAATLTPVRAELRALLDKLRFRTRQNAELLKASMEHVNAFMEMIARAGEVKTYSRKGLVERQQVRLFDRSA